MDSNSRFSRLNRVFSRLNLAWAVFQPYSNEEQTLPKCNRTNIGSKGLCQSATRPYMLLDASPKAWSNIHKRIFTQIWLKNPKIGIFTKPIQIKSKFSWRSVRNSYLTTKDNYSHRCEIKISPFLKIKQEEAWKQMENQPLFNTTQMSLNLSSKTRTFPKLGLGNFWNSKREWVGEEEGDAYQWVLIDFGARTWILLWN